MIKRFTLSFFVVFIFLTDVGGFFFWAKKINTDTFGLFFSADNQIYFARIIAFLFFWLALALYFKIYFLKRADRFLSISNRFISHVLIYFLVIQVLAMTFFSRPPRLEDGTLLLLIVTTQLLFRLVIFITIHALRTHVEIFKDAALILGDNRLSCELNRFLKNNPKIGFEAKTFGERKTLTLSKNELQQQKIKALFVAQENINKKKYKHAIETAALLQIPIYIFADYDAIYKSNQIDYFGYIPVYKTQFSPLLQGSNSYVKRMFDIVFSSLVILLILSWMYPLLGLLIKLESKGPILFVQDRNGLGNKLFKCFKFRSMTINSSNAQAQKYDTRITKIGRFIRKTSIDELTQFFNVLLGDMSVVGPRPHMEIHNTNYEKQVPSFQLRHTIKPGITGMAQARGFRGEIKADFEIINRIKYDIFYIRNWSFALDIKIIIRTVLNIIRGEEKAY